MSRIVLPGSEGEESDPRGGGTGDGDAAALGGLLHWWRHRLARADAADPLTSAIGGVDDSGTARTSGLLPAAVVFARPVAVPAGGLSVWVHALGVPEAPAATGDVYSLVGLCHFYHDAAAGWLSRYTTLGRAPAWITSTEVRAAAVAGPVISIVGVAGVTIAWKVEVYRLERA